MQATSVTRQPVPFLDLKAQHHTIESELNKAIGRVVSRGDFILGEDVARFEEEFASFAGAKHAIGVASGLDALRLSLSALEVGPGDEVILPANTFIATALAVSSLGARPVLVDCTPDTYNIDTPQIEAAITAKTRAIIPVHLTGQSADMDPILEIAERTGLFVVEDACQAHGASYRGRPCGSMGRAGCFSFYPGKNLGAFGDGGLVTTNDEGLAERLRRLRNYGQKVKYQHVEQGVNSRLDTLQAAILRVKLKRLSAWNTARRKHAARYEELLADEPGVTLQQCLADLAHVYHLFIVQTDRPVELQKHLAEHEIQTGIHYPIPVHLQQAYAGLGYRQGDFPVAEQLAGRILSLPMFPELRPGQIDFVCSAVRDFF